MSAPRGIALLGATGSIGASTIDVVRGRPDAFRIVALAAGSNADAIVALAREFGPEMVALADEEAADRAAAALSSTGIEVRGGSGAVEAAARCAGVERVVNGIVGAAGLSPTLAALEAGLDVALANKESLVVGGELVTRTAAAHGARLVPIDSEHCSLFQCLEGRDPAQVREVVLTASGGPFRTRPLAEIDALAPGEALRHPTWQMGARITVDSATLMNKGLEVIEARWLFDLPPERIRVLVHPESIVHAMVILADGSAIAHLSPPDMRLPIAFALAHPDPTPRAFDALDLASVGTLSFEHPDRERFPCLALAEEALGRGGTAPAVLNAADEVCVAGYLAGRIRFSEIADVVRETLASHDVAPGDRLESLMRADRWGREEAERRIDARAASEGEHARA